MFTSASLALLASIAIAQQGPKPALNTICPVIGSRVCETSRTVTVRGQAYRYCRPSCARKLEKNPEKYLNQDGSQKNGKKCKKG
jgi:YHS domain-containing protein